MSHPVSPRAGACDVDRVDRFLAADHYRMEDELLISHLDECDGCREYLESRAGGADVWTLATALLQPGEFDAASSSIYGRGESPTSLGPVSTGVQEVLDSLAPTDDPHRLGRIGGHEVVSVVGVGGMGVVLKAVDPSLDRVVAIKAMAPRLANSETARKRFAREAKAAAAVLHPNVTPIYSVSSDGPLPYLVMAFVRGGSLQKRLETDGPLPLVEILRIGSQIAAGLAAAHDQGLVHRDIKPENILLEQGVERVAITDFGLARAVDDNTMTQAGVISGTPMYMSPEQARGERVGQASDLFSLGSVLHALCTGVPPYRGESSLSVMRRIIDDEPEPIRESNRDIPDWFCQIVERLMKKSPEDRFRSARDVSELLEKCLNHVQQPNVVALPNMDVMPRPRPSRAKWLWGGLGLVLVIVCGLAINAPFGGGPPASDEVPKAITESTVFEVREVDEELASRLIGRREHLTFSRLESLTPEVATILARNEGNLSLPAVRTISPEVARALADKRPTHWLILGGLEEVSTQVASELSGANCAVDLRGLKKLTPEAGVWLNSVSTLSLGMTSITPELADILSRHRGWLSLNRVNDLEPRTASILATHKTWLSLNGLRTLTPETARALGRFDADTLDLNGVQTLDIETATALADANCRSQLSLNGLSRMTPELFNVLANGNSGLSLQGLGKIDEATVSAIEASRPMMKKARRSLLVRWK